MICLVPETEKSRRSQVLQGLREREWRKKKTQLSTRATKLGTSNSAQHNTTRESPIGRG